MRLTPRKRPDGHITAYFATVGSKEARDAGFIRPDGNSRISERWLTPKRGRLPSKWIGKRKRIEPTCDAERGARVLPLYLIAILA